VKKDDAVRLSAPLLVLSALVAGCATEKVRDDIAKFDPAMAVEASAVKDGVKWLDGSLVPLEGRAFDDVDGFYDRLPRNLSTHINSGVHYGKSSTAGLQFRFSTDSTNLHFRWKVSGRLQMYHMPATGGSGIDVYRRQPDGTWRYTRDRCHLAEDLCTCDVKGRPGDAYIVNLPLYNGLEFFKVGIDEKATVCPLGPRKSGIDKPVVFYGTSITQGGCCSRPGMSFVNIVGRDLDVPVVNLGFSGSGKMEIEMSEVLSRIDASCYVLDCLWNMNFRMVASRYEPFIRDLRARRPDVPIVMAERCDVACEGPTDRDRFVRELYEKLVAEGWKNLVYLPKTEMYSGDGEGTVDGCHANDLGMKSMSLAFGKAVRQALGL